MASVSIVKVKVRRGTDSQRQQIILDQGEIAYVTDLASRRLFVGDGFTVGGNSAGWKLTIGSISTPTNLTTVQTGDIVFNTDNNSLYSLSGLNSSGFPDYANPGAYAYIGPQTDNQTLVINQGMFQLNTAGISAVHVSNSVFDYTNGFARTGNGLIRINYDNSSLQINNSGQLYVNLANVASNTLPLTNPGPNRLWNNGGVVSIGH
jgi:hypothetical protein